MAAEGITPVYDVNGTKTSDTLGMGGSWIWIILLFFLFGAGGNGFGQAANATTNLINNDFLYTQQKVDNLNQTTNNGFASVNSALNQGFNGVQMSLCNLGHQIDSGFCSANRNIDQVRFENAQNTCAITTAINGSTQQIKDLINGNTMQDLRDRNVELYGALNNSQQTAAIVEALNPCAKPAYLTTAPVAYNAMPLPPVVGFGYGYGGFKDGFRHDGCGCHEHHRCC